MNYFKETPFAVTVCDKEGRILEMNDKSVKTFTKDGQALTGKSLLDCHPESARLKLSKMLEEHNVNVYTIEKNGVKKMIYQSPYYDNGDFAGYIELSMEIPFEMPHHIRK
jgi:transcriptional regulator with PAS, ATPase and Fis domain